MSLPRTRAIQGDRARGHSGHQDAQPRTALRAGLVGLASGVARFAKLSGFRGRVLLCQPARVARVTLKGVGLRAPNRTAT
jgi:hypothetical protein